MNDENVTIQVMEENLHASSSNLETVTFGMGCFWSPEARFGGLPGVMRTRVGYAGGTTASPTYRNMGDHTETIELDFNPRIVPFEDILRYFWRNHYPNRDQYKGRQYISLLRYRDENQRKTITSIKKEMEAELGEEIETEIGPFTSFTLAEERHQKYYLKRYPQALEQLHTLFPELKYLVHSSFAARLNGFVKGFITRDALVEDISNWEIKPVYRELLIKQLLKMKW